MNRQIEQAWSEVESAHENFMQAKLATDEASQELREKVRIWTALKIEQAIQFNPVECVE